MDENVSATVNILGRPYKLKIGASDEQFLRKAAESINNQAQAYGKNFAFNDHQDLLAMVALTQITQLTKLQSGLKFKDSELEDKLTAINALLDDHLANER